MSRYIIESINEPKRYWLESHAVRGWFPDRGAASYFGEHDRKCMPLPVGGVWVEIDKPVQPTDHRYIIESIAEPKHYYAADMVWVTDRAKAKEFDQLQRARYVPPRGGCWVIVDEPKAGTHHFTTIKLRPVALRLSAPDGEYDDLNAQAAEFEAALRQWVKKQQILNGSEWDIDFVTED